MSETTELAVIKTLTPAVAFAPGKIDDLLSKLEENARAEVFDISTKSGRDRLRSYAAKLASSKVALDDMGKDLTEEWRKGIGVVNEERRKLRDRLEALRVEIRQPLTDYENRETARVQGHEDALAALSEPSSFYQMQQPSEGLATRLAWLRDRPDRDWQEFSARAERTLASEIALTEQALNRELAREQAEAEAIRLAAEEAARIQAEREARIAAEAAEQARLAAEARAEAEAEAARRAAAAREREAQERAEAIRAEAARKEREAAEREAQIKAQAEADRLAAERREQEAKAREERLAAEAAAAAQRAEQARVAAEQKAERDRVAAVEAERLRAEKQRRDEEAAVAAEAERQAQEDARRAADKRHRAAVNNAAMADLVKAGIDADVARQVVVAIARGDVSHVKMGY